MNGRIRFLAPILACTVLAAAQGHAATPLSFLPASVLFGAQPARPVCAPAFAQPAAGLSKASALLGGAPSALERMREQQVTASLAPASTPPCTALPAAPERTALVFAPLGTGALPQAFPAAPAPGEFLASRRLAVGHTTFDGQWARVSHATLGSGAVSRIGMASGLSGLARLKAVNSWANAHVRYAEDRVLFGQADYWADARETLRRRAGDCEDIAILKLQLLAAAGVPREAMFLTIARDLVRHADHALLIVRDGGTFWILDNATDVLVDAGPSADYRPIFSFGQNGKWLHGYAGQIAAAAPAQVPVPAAAMVALSASLIDAPAIAVPALDFAVLDAGAPPAAAIEPVRLALNAR